MSIAYDNESTIGLGTGDRNWNHVPSGTPRGVLVIIVDGVTTDQVVGVTYGGSAMTEVSGSPNVLSGGEGGAVHVFWKGSSIATGTQQVAVDRNDATNWDAVCYSVTADSDTYIHNVQTSSSTATTSPGATLTITEEAFVAGGVYSGENNPATSAPTGAQNTITLDFGTDTGAIARGTSIKTSDYAFTWSQASNDGVTIVVAMGQTQKYKWAQAQATIRSPVRGYGQAGATIVATHPRQMYQDVIFGTTGLVAYWRLGEPSGTVAVDSKNGHNGSYSDTDWTQGQTGAVGDDNTSYLAANKYNGAINVTDHDDLDLGDIFSIEFWIKRTTTATFEYIIDKGASTYAIYIDSSNKIRLTSGGSSTTSIIESSTSLTDTTSWHHHVVTKDGSTRKWYIDGSDVTTLGTNSTLSSSAINLEIGSSTYWSGADDCVSYLDEIALYKGYAMTSTDVSNHYAARLLGIDSRPFGQAQAKILSGVAAKAYAQAQARIALDKYGEVVYKDNPLLYYRMGLKDIRGTFACGGECVLSDHWTEIQGASLDSGTKYTGNNSIKITAAGSTAYIRRAFIRSNAYVAVAKFRIRFSSLPAANASLFNFQSSDADNAYLGYEYSTGKLVVCDETWANRVAGPAISVDTWYEINIVAECDVGAPRIQWRVNNIPQTTFTGSNATGTFHSWTFGQREEYLVSYTTYTMFVDDFKAAEDWLYQYPLKDEWFPVEETSQSIAYDEMQTFNLKYDGTIPVTDGLAYPFTDKASALDSGATYQRIYTESSGVPAGSSSGVSLEGWAVPYSLDFDEYYCITSWGIVHNTINFAWFGFHPYGTSWPFRMLYQWSDGTAYRSVYLQEENNNFGVSVNTRHHFAVVHDYTAETVKFYIDGSLKGTLDVSAYATPSAIPANQYLSVGQYSGNRLNNFNGVLDEISIYDSVLTANQIYAHWSVGSGGVFAQAQARIKQIYPIKGYDTVIKATPNLKGYWRLNEPQTSNTAVDSSGNGKDGTYGGDAPTRGIPGALEDETQTATWFHRNFKDQAKSSKVVVPHSSYWDWGNSARTIEVWFNRVHSYGYAYQYIIAKGSWGQLGFDEDNTILWDQDGSVSAWSTTKYGLGGDPSWPNWAPDNIVNGWSGWHHLVATHDPTAAQYHHIYVDGVDVTNTDTDFNNNFGNSTMDLYISRYYDDNNADEFDGGIHDLAVYDRALTLEEARNHYLAGVGGYLSYEQQVIGDSPISYWRLGDYRNLILSDKPRSYWRLGESGGSTAYDELGVNNGTYYGITLNATGAVKDSNTAATFPGDAGGNNDAVQISSPTGLPSGSADRTIEAWFKTSASDEFMDILSWGNDTTNTSWVVQINQTSSIPRVLISTAGGSSYDYTFGDSDTPLFNGVWHHIAVTLSNSTTLTVYIDGVLLEASGFPNPKTLTTAPNTAVGTQGLLIGAQSWYGSGSWWETFNGQLDEVVIYNYALTSAQILKHYQVGTGTVVDEMGVNNGTYYGSYTLGQTGALTDNTDTSVFFDQTTYGRAIVKANGAIISQLKTLDPARSASFTIEAWVKIDGWPAWDDAIYTERGSTGNDIVKLQVNWETGHVQFVYRDDAGTVNWGPTSLTDVTDNRWHHIVLTKWGTDANIYIDGEWEDQQTLTVTDTLTNSSIKVRISGDEGDGSANFHGYIDEVAVYDYVLTPLQIKRHYQAATIKRTLPFAQAQATIKQINIKGFAQALAEIRDPYKIRVLGDSPVAYWRLNERPSASETYRETILSDNPVGYWRLDDASGTLAVNKGLGDIDNPDFRNSPYRPPGPTKYDGTYWGTTTLGVTGALDNSTNTAITLDNSTAFVEVPNSYELWTQTDFTIEAWFKTTSSGWGIIAAKKSDTGNTSGWYLALDDAAQFKFGIGEDTTQYTLTASSSGYRDGNWHHIVGKSYNIGSANYLQIWVDGNTLTNPMTTANMDHNAYATPLRIGFISEASTYFDGSIDEVAYYRGGLPEHRIVEHYKAGKYRTLNSISPNYVVQDSFTRSSSSGWGTASERGGTWTHAYTPDIVADPTKWTVDGSVAKYTLDATQSNGIIAEAAISSSDAPVLYKDTVQIVKWRLDKLKTGGSDGLVSWFMSRMGNLAGPSWEWDWNNRGYYAAWGVSSAGAVDVVLQWSNNGVHTTLESATGLGTYVANDWWWAKFEHIGETLKLKVWKDGDTEPNWQVTATDSRFTNHGQVGIGTYTDTITNYPVVFSYDSYSVNAYDTLWARDTGSPTYGQTGALTGSTDTAISFNGTTDNLIINHSPIFGVGNGPFSIEFWAKRTRTATDEELLDKSTQFDIGFNGSDKLKFEGYGTANYIATESGTTADTNWHHFVITRANTGTGNTKIYKDNVDVTSEGPSIGENTYLDTSFMIIGDSQARNQKFAGLLDEIAFYNIVLTPIQVQDHWTLANSKSIVRSGQAMATISAAGAVTRYGHAQAQAQIKAIAVKGYAQAQAQIKTTYRGFAQAQAQIRATYWGYAQAQARIKTTYASNAQGQARIKTTYTSNAQGQARIKTTYWGYSQAQARIKTTYTSNAQAQARVKALGVQGYAQALATVKAFAIKAYAQAQAWLKIEAQKGLGQVQAQIRVTYSQLAQAQARIKTTYWNNAQAQADIKQTYNVSAQAQAWIKITNLNSFAQAQARIKTTYAVCGLAQAQIRSTYHAFAQAQANIKQTYQGFAQAMGHIKVTDVEGLAQAQALIRQTYSQYAQAQALVYIPVYYSPTADITNNGWVRTVSN